MNKKLKTISQREKRIKDKYAIEFELRVKAENTLEDVNIANAKMMAKKLPKTLAALEKYVKKGVDYEVNPAIFNNFILRCIKKIHNCVQWLV